MVKARKPKNEESAAAKPAENSEARVHHQKLCLSIDFNSRQVYGYTELEVMVPDIGIVGLHAENLGIGSVLVDGEPTVFEYYPHHQNSENENRWSLVSSPSSAADAAASAYVLALKREDTPNLLVNCCKPSKVLAEQLEHMNLENGSQSSGEAKQNIKLVRINYWIDKMESGIHFIGNMVHTDNQIKRARCWFPCIDEEYQRCSFDLEITVPHNFVAVGVGNLLCQVLSKDDPPRKTYVYKLNIPIAARWMSLLAAPFEILADRRNPLISNMCLPSDLSKLYNTLDFFHEAFSYYEDYLSAKFPFGSYKQVFLPPDSAISSSTLGASLSIFSSEVLYDERVIDQTIDTRIKLASALARQWFGVYITPESSNDEWLLDGLAGFLTDMFIKKFLGNNEARYRRYKANCAVCKADDSGATCLSSSASCKDLYGTHRIGIYGKMRSWKSVTILQMLEKQMGPESFRKILQRVVSRAKDPSSTIRSLSTKEFRHFANKIGNLERPFLKEFFHRWVASFGCPVLRIGFSYNKRKNIIEMAVLRECTASLDLRSSDISSNPDLENRDGDVGWPGIMSIRVYELDAMSDHPKLPMAGETWQLLEMPCHSKLAAKRYQKPKKGSKADGSDDNVDAVATLENRFSVESPLSWIRADPEMEYLAEVHLHQPVQMWINQLEKDGDVVAQAQAISALEALQQPSFSIVNALNNILCDSKAFWRIRAEAAFALAKTASEETDWFGLQQLIKFYKGRRFDADVGLPKPNDFCDYPEYFVLEVIPRAIAMVRAADNKSPREAVEFILQLLKYNDNSGNPYSDVFWLAAVVESIGDLEFSQQSILFLSPLLKRIDRLLQFDRLMPSFNGILTISCIRTLVQIALKLSAFLNLDHVRKLIEPFRNLNSLLQVRVEASRALLDIELFAKGINAALSLFVKYTEEEPSLRGQVKLCVHAMRLCQITVGSYSGDNVDTPNLVGLLHLLESCIAFNNEVFRHHLFCIFQILAGRPPTLYGVPKDKSLLLGDLETCIEPKNIFAAPVPETIHRETSQALINEALPPDLTNFCSETKPPELSTPFFPEVKPPESFAASLSEIQHPETALDIPDNLSHENLIVQETKKEENAQKEKDVPKETTSVSVSVSREAKRQTLKIRVKSSAATSRADGETRTIERSQGAITHHDMDRGATSSVSVDAPQRNSGEALSISNNQNNPEEVNSCHDHGSRMTASIGSVKLAGEGDNFGKELQCTADSAKMVTNPLPYPNPSSSPNIDTDAQKFASLKTLSAGKEKEKGKKKGKEKKDKEKKRKREDPEYMEKKRLKKEKKQKEKEMAKLLSNSTNLSSKKEATGIRTETVQTKPNEPSGSRVIVAKETKSEPSSEARPASKFRIKIKSKTFNNC